MWYTVAMSSAWKQIDLAGGGLQSANLALTRRLKKRGIAYALWLAGLPLGLHAVYLRAWPRAALYLAAVGAIAALWALNWPRTAGGIGAVLALWALYDLVWIERRIVAINKEIRMAVYLRPNAGAPKNFRGHYRDDELADYMAEKDRERAGHQPAARKPGAGTPSASRRGASFAEQEALLRELAQHKPRDKKR